MRLNWSRGGWKDSPDPLYPRWSLVIEAYFDDSGKQGDSKFVCMAGFLAHDSYWMQFVIDWKHLLARHGINCIHMKDLMTGNKEFAGLTIEQKNKIIFEFASVIKRHLLIGFGVATDTKVWNNLPREFQKAYGNSQEFCFARLLRGVRDRLNKSGNPDYVAVIFDHDMELSKPRLTRFDDILKRDEWAREKFASICFGNSRMYCQLQAADMLAWETRRLVETKVNAARPTFGSSAIFSSGSSLDLEFAFGEYWDHEEF